MTQSPQQTSMMGPGAAPPPPGPYCRELLDSGPYICGRCGRDPSAPRRPCPKCGRVTPTAERACWSCGAAFKSDMRWKASLIVALFLLSLVLSVVLAIVKALVR